MQQNIDGLLLFDNFLSTSADHDVSLMFARSARDDSNQVGVLFRMNLEGSANSIRSPLACLTDASFYPDEQEILFSMHTIFRVIDIRDVDTRLWLVELDLTIDEDEQLSELLKQLREENPCFGCIQCR